jgi:hypothetical protein
METFYEILITAVFTFFAGFLCVRYKPKRKKRSIQNRNQHIRVAYRNNSAKFILVFLFGIMVFSSLFFLAERGYIHIKW